jgi:hypothetical protein
MRWTSCSPAARPIPSRSCQWSARTLGVAKLRIFGRRYPRGENFIVTHDAERPVTRLLDDLTVTILAPGDLVGRVSKTF